jgi:uncharacterized integral membrane protein
MSILRIVLLALLAISLLLIALANRGPVEVKLLPEDLAVLLGFQAAATLPLYFVIFAAIALGVGVGYVAEYFREAKHRRAAARERARADKLETRLEQRSPREEDEVLALVEQPR